MAGFTDLLGAAGGGGYGNSGSSGVSTPINTGGIGSQTFTFGGNPNIQTALTSPWLLIGVGVAVLLLWRKLR